MLAGYERVALRCAMTAIASLAGLSPGLAQPDPARSQPAVPMHQEVSPDAAKLGFSPDQLRLIASVYEKGVAAGDIPGAVVMIARDGKLVYSAVIGYRDAAAKQPMRLDTRFHLASMTKPLTSVAAMILAEKGRLLLDDPVAKYIPQFAGLKVGREVVGTDGKTQLILEPLRRPPTIRDLLRHTSGFTYGPFGSSLVQQAYMKANLTDYDQTNAELVTKLAALPLAYQPGQTFEYSMSTDVLGRVIEVASGMSLARFVSERITMPLGMRDTSFSEEELSRIAPLSGAPVASPTGTPRWFSGGGGMIGTAADYLRFGEMMLGRGALGSVRLLSPHTVASMTTNQLPAAVEFGPYDLGSLAPTPEAGQGFGYGFAVRLNQGRNPAPGSIGDYHWAGSSGTYFWVDPREGLVAVVLTAAPAVRSAYRIKARQLVYQALTIRKVSP